jgi:WD40 repeat protein
LSENARYVAIQDRDYSIRVLDVEHSNNIVQLFGHRSSIVDIDYYLEGGMLISAGSDGAVNIWNLLSGEIIKNFNCSDSDIREVKYNSRLSMAIIVNGENDIALWDVISEKRIAKLGGHDSQISIALRYDGKLLASGSDDFRIRIWELDHS